MLCDDVPAREPVEELLVPTSIGAVEFSSPCTRRRALLLTGFQRVVRDYSSVYVHSMPRSQHNRIAGTSAECDRLSASVCPSTGLLCLYGIERMYVDEREVLSLSDNGLGQQQHFWKRDRPAMWENMEEVKNGSR